MSNPGGAARPITLYGTPVLHRRCADVTAFDAALAELVDAMFASMYEAEGVGLAANQIGVDLRVFVYDCPDDDDVEHKGHMVNPRVEAPAGTPGEIVEAEGCLSVPGARADLARPGVVTVTGQDLNGRPITVTGTGYFARCLLHETEHLDGTLFVDHLPGEQRDELLHEAGLR